MRAARVAGFVVKVVARAAWVSLMVLTPLFGFWLASSLAAYVNATQWLSLLVGLLLFPLLPVGWDVLSVWRRNRRAAADTKPAKPAILTRLDRLVLRTLLINGVFLAGMMWQARATSFRALAVRGDWMLDGYNGPIASTMRGWLLGFADRLDRRTTTHDDRYGDSDEAPDDVKPATADTIAAPLPDANKSQSSGWPMPVAYHPLATSIPESEQTSIATVGAYFAARLPDKRERIKALHDYVAIRIHYDYDALAAIEARDHERIPSQEAEPVFARRAGVCAGYAKLMVELGKAAGLEIAYVTGAIRDSRRRLSISSDPWDTSLREALEGVHHAWNAVKLDDGWYLMDVTWDDPTKGDPSTEYLLVPPRLMIYDHFPDDPKWQLLNEPLSLGDFVRQPMMQPQIGALGMSLVTPTRSQVTSDGPVEIVLANPLGSQVIAQATPDGDKPGPTDTHCDVESTPLHTTVTCDLPPGEYEVNLFGALEGRGGDGYDYFGSILVNSQ